MARHFLWIGVFILLLAGCMAEESNEGGLFYEPDNTEASVVTTPQPIMRTPPEARRWQASPVLVRLTHYSGGLVFGFGNWVGTDDLVVYRDGLVLKKEYRPTAAGTKEVLWQGQLTPAQLCAFMLRIEEDGFFDFTPDEYVEPMAFHVGSTSMDVYGWRQQEIDAYGLSFSINQGYTHNIPEGLRQPYTWLDNYMPPNPVPYVPERIQVRIQSHEFMRGSPSPLWTIGELSLTELLLTHGTVNIDGKITAAFELEGDAIEPFWSHFAENRQQEFLEGNQPYIVGVRPILPYEQVDIAQAPTRDTAEFATTPTAELDCTSSDLAQFAGEILPQPTHEPLFSLTPEATATPAPKPLEIVEVLGRRDMPGQFDGAGAIAISPQNEIVVGDPSNARLQWFTPEGELLRVTPLEFEGDTIYPTSMIFTPDGTLLFLGNLSNELYELTPEGTVRLVRQGWTGIEKHQSAYEFPDYVTQAKDGTLYVVNTIEHEKQGVVILHPDSSETIWMEAGGISFNYEGNRANIGGLGMDDDGNFYIALREQDSILKVATTGEVIQFETPEPMSLRVMPDGSFAVISWDTLSLYDANGNLQHQWKPSACGGGYLDDFAMGADGMVYVVNGFLSAPEIICRYQANGELLNSFGDNAIRDGQFSTHVAFSASPHGDVWLMGQSSGDLTGILSLQHLAADGTFLQRIEHDWEGCNDYSLAAHSDQTVFVADPCHATITHYATTGQVLHEWGSLGTGADEFNLIRAITLAPDEQSLYVVDEGNNRITQWSFTGSLLAQWAGKDLGVDAVIDLAVAPDGTFFLLDKATGEVVVYGNGSVTTRWSLPTPEETVSTIAYDEATNWLVVGGSSSLIFIYQPDGTYLGEHEMTRGLFTGQLVERGAAGQFYTSNAEARIYRWEAKE